MIYWKKRKMKKIKLTRGKFALIDDSDFEWLSQWKWNAHNRNGKLYAARGKYERLGFYKYKMSTISMHREIMKAEKGQEIDHINGDSLDNRRGNLRITDRFGNCQNASLYKNNKSGYKGVHFVKDTQYKKKKWVAYIQSNKKLQHLGYFATAKEAAQAYNKKAKELFGEYAKENLL